MNVALEPTALFLGDNGRLFCGAMRCAGSSAYHTGRDLSGQRVHRLTGAERSTLGAAIGREPSCEACGRDHDTLADEARLRLEPAT